jgi:1-acyl-sn-glycerol-3-phosphate acyltransferase
MSSRAQDPTRESIPLSVVRHTVALLVRLIFRVRVLGTEHVPRHGPVLVAGNHTGFLDGPIVFMFMPRPSSFLVKSELYAGPWAKVLAFAQQIPVRRGAPDRTALRRALDVLAAGGVLGVFPEGTRGEGRLESVQHGIGYLALRAGAPVVPVVCLGTAEALPKGKLLPRLRSPVDVIFGAAFEIEVSGDPRARSTIADAAEQVRRHLLAHLDAVSPADAA